MSLLSKFSRRGFLKYGSLSGLAAFVTSCLSSNAPPASPTASGAATASGATTAVVSRADTITLKMQSTWGTRDLHHEIFLDWGKKAEELSNGRLKIDILPSGAVVGAFDLIDAVHSGTLDGGHGVPAYWFGKNRAASLFGTGAPMGMDANDVLGWVNYGGGQELYNELLTQVLRLNVVSFFHGPMTTQPLGWFKNEIKGPDDFKGVKFRTVGMAIDVYTALGATVVAIPGAEVVASLERGVIDAAEYNNTSSDRALGFGDVRKVLMAGSYHQQTEFFEVLFNKQKYDALPADIKTAIKYANMAESADMAWKWMDRNSKDLLELEKLTPPVRFIKTPQSVLEAQLRAWDAILAKDIASNPFFKKVYDSQRAWAERVINWKLKIQIGSPDAVAYNHFFKK